MSKVKFMWNKDRVDAFLVHIDSAMIEAMTLRDVRSWADLLRLKFDVLTSELDFEEPFDPDNKAK